MLDSNNSPKDEHWTQALGEGARDVLEDLQGQAGRVDAERAFELLTDALGEDGAAPLFDPGLPEDYEVLEVIGRGASGVVYRALQQDLGREVAVKVLRHGGDTRETERLLGEARRLAALVHPGIVAVHEVGRATTGVYVTLELQPGGSLQALLSKEPINPARAARLTRQAAEALAYTHSRGVVHLDLKPGNVLLDADGNARVADFGLAREVAAMELSATSGGLLGTPAFMAPEQAADRRNQFGERTDVYGLGAMLYACLAGAPPFAQRSLLSTLQAVRFEEPAALGRVAPGTPRDLIAITAKAMAKLPQDRYPTAQAMALDLARFEASEPVQARLPGRLARTGRLLRRNGREIAIALAASLVALLSVLPFRTGAMNAAGGRLRAADELIQAGELKAASLLLDWAESEGDLSEEDTLRLARLRGSAALDPGQEEASEQPVHSRRAKSAEKLGLSREDLTWIDETYGKEWLQATVSWLKSPLDVERAWRSLIGTLGPKWKELDDGDRKRVLTIAAAAPHWNWKDGFGGWLTSAPHDARELLDAVPLPLAARELLPSYGVLIDVFLVDKQGNATKIGSHRKAGRLGESLRIEGRGASGMKLPVRHLGKDFLHLSPSGPEWLRSGEVRYEVEGVFESMAGGVMWNINDQETYLGLDRRDGSWFLDAACDGLMAGRPGLLEAHQYLWSGDQRATILMFGEVVEGDQIESDLAERDLSAWAQRFALALQAELALPFDRPDWMQLPPLPRGTLLDLVQGLAVLDATPAKGALDLIAKRLSEAEIDAASLSDDFFERGTFTGTTSAGADFEFWLGAAREATAGEHPGIGAILSDLPLPFSEDSGNKPGFDKRAWFFSGYVLVGLLLLLAALCCATQSPVRVLFLGVAMVIAAQGIDKTAPFSLGEFRWDPVSLGIMAWSAHLLTPMVGRWARVACWALAVAALQELLDNYVWVPQVRLPFALAMVALAFVAARLDRWSILGWLPAAAALLFGSVILVHISGLGSPTLMGWLASATLAGCLVVLMSITLLSIALLNRSLQAGP